jgi:hypothetical protein
VPVRPYLPLGLLHQDVGDARAAMGGRDVHLLDLVAHDHDEAGDGPVDRRHRRVADPFERTRPE